MTRWILVASLSLRLLVGSAATQGPSSDVAVLKTLQDGLIAWFNSLSSSFDKIAENEDRRKLKATLVDLDKAIYDLEFNGRYLVDALRRKPVVEEEVIRAVTDTRQALSKVASKLHPVGFLLRTEHRAGGEAAEKLIADAMGKRTQWLDDVEAGVRQRKIEPKLIEEGEEALAMHETASMALIRVIEKL
jgi:hypothetical protein